MPKDEEFYYYYYDEHRQEELIEPIALVLLRKDPKVESQHERTKQAKEEDTQMHYPNEYPAQPNHSLAFTQVRSPVTIVYDI